VTDPIRGIPSGAAGNLRRRPFDSLAVALVAVVAIAWLITPATPPLDDAYIVVHSSEVLRRGVDAAYRAPALTGITSPAFLLIVFLFQSLAGGLAGLRLATAAGVAAFVLGVWVLAGAAGATGPRRWLVLIAALSAGPTAINLVNGLETGWTSALLAWALAGVLLGKPLLVAAASGLVPALRPDLAPLAAALVAVAAWNEGRRGWRVAAVSVAIALPFIVWIRLNTGAWWPSTMDAKRLFFAEGCLSAEMKAGIAARHLAAWAAVAAPIAAGVIASLRDRLGRIAVSAAALAIGVYGWSLPGALYHNEYRYLVPMLTPIGVYGFARMISARTRGALVAAAILIAIGSVTLRGYGLGRRSDAQELQQIAAWATANFPSGARVLVHDAGVISTVEGIHVVDVVGLKTPPSIEAHRRWTWPSCGVERGRAVDAIARAARPDYFIVLDRWDEIFHFTNDLERLGWELTLVNTPSGLERSYSVYRIALRDRGAAADRK
jgi:hypothetical protein